jgi:hypothetical protein
VTAAIALAVGLALALPACGRKAPVRPPELVRPEPPESLAAVAIPEGVRLSWRRPVRYTGGGRMNDLGGFIIERAPGEGAPATFAQIGRIDLQDQTRFQHERRIEWVDHDAVRGERYLYRVVAFTLDGSRNVAGPISVRFGPEPPTPEDSP